MYQILLSIFYFEIYLKFDNVKASSNHRANACSCFKRELGRNFAPMLHTYGRLAFIFPVVAQTRLKTTFRGGFSQKITLE
jgi:hypothetical protein